MTSEMTFLRTVTFVALLIAVTGAEELPPNGFYHGLQASHPGFHGYNNPHFPVLVTEPDIADTPNVIGTDQADTDNDSGDYLITKDAGLPKGQEEIDEENEEVEPEGKYVLESRKSIKVECDFLNQPRYSCYSCYQYLECKGMGEGKVKSCKNPLAPYCVNGICSPNPSAECT